MEFSDVDPKKVVDYIKGALEVENVGFDSEAGMFTVKRRGSTERFLSEHEILDLPRSILHQILKILRDKKMKKGDEKLVQLRDNLINSTSTTSMVPLVCPKLLMIQLKNGDKKIHKISTR
jgi:hypothetical protein